MSLINGYIVLDNSEIVPKGNFAFIYEKTQDEKLLKKFLDFESIFKISYVDFSHKIRVAYEAIALREELEYRKQQPDNEGKTDEQIEKEIIAQITNPSSPFNYKKILTRLTNSKSSAYIPMLEKYEFWSRSSDDYDGVRALKKYIKFVYDFASKSSHVNNKIEKKYVPNKENCFRVIKSFHDFLCVYYSVDHKFDSTLIPIWDYYAVPKETTSKMGLRLETGNYLFVKERNQKIKYFIFATDTSSITLNQRRAIETVNKLWEDNFDDPNNIIRQTERISGTNLDYKYQVYALPGKPLKLIDDFISKLSFDEKIDIIKGICNGVNSMHTYEPPFYHRNITPESFYIFSVKNKYKALLARFDYAKDTDENASYTIFADVVAKMKKMKENPYIAPELQNKEIGDATDWEKADIYSLGKTCLYILIGTDLKDAKEEIRKLSDLSLDNFLVNTIAQMVDSNVSKRPVIGDVVDFLQYI